MPDDLSVQTMWPSSSVKTANLFNYSACLVLTILSIFLLKFNVFFAVLFYILSKIKGVCCCRVFSIKTIVNKAVFN